MVDCTRFIRIGSWRCDFVFWGRWSETNGILILIFCKPTTQKGNWMCSLTLNELCSSWTSSSTLVFRMLVMGVQSCCCSCAGLDSIALNPFLELWWLDDVLRVYMYLHAQSICVSSSVAIVLCCVWDMQFLKALVPRTLSVQSSICVQVILQETHG
jgi:hypothetical protein